MNRKHPTAVKRVVFVTIAGLEQIEMFEQRDMNSSKTIKEDIKLQISNMLDIPAVFCNRKVQRIATKNTECCHPIFSLLSRQCVG